MFIHNSTLNFSNVLTKYNFSTHYSDVIMGMMASQITSLTIVCSTVYSGADQRKHQSLASLAFAQGIHRRLVNSLHRWPVTRKMLPFDDIIMRYHEILRVHCIPGQIKRESDKWPVAWKMFPFDSSWFIYKILLQLCPPCCDWSLHFLG